MEKIIYATDFSENSVAALKYAYHLGKLLNTEIIVLHVFDPDDLSQTRTAEEKKLVVDHHTSRLQKFCSLNLQQNFDKLNLTLAVIKGENVTQKILHFMKDKEVLMIVLGSCGSGTVREYFLGSVTKSLFSSSPIPVFAIPGNFEFEGINKVMFTSNLEEKDIYHLEELIRILKPIEYNITVVHVTPNKEEEARKLMEWFRKLVYDKIKFSQIEFKIIYSKDVLTTLLKCLEEIGADLLVMMAPKDKLATQTILRRDLIIKMQSKSRVPILSYREVH